MFDFWFFKLVPSDEFRNYIELFWCFLITKAYITHSVSSAYNSIRTESFFSLSIEHFLHSISMERKEKEKEKQHENHQKWPFRLIKYGMEQNKHSQICILMFGLLHWTAWKSWNYSEYPTKKNILRSSSVLMHLKNTHATVSIAPMNYSACSELFSYRRHLTIPLHNNSQPNYGVVFICEWKGINRSKIDVHHVFASVLYIKEKMYLAVIL